MSKNVLEINDTDINLDKIVQNSSNIAIDKEPLPFALPTTSNAIPKFNQMVEKAKTPLQLKKEEIQREAPEARRLRLLILNRYKLSARFGVYLESLGFNLNPTNINTMTISELDSLINDIRFCISTKNVHSFWQDATTQGVGIVERVISPWYNVTGLSTVLSNDDTYKDVCEELILEHQHYLYCKPEYRLAYSIFKTATAVHSQHEFFKTPEGKKEIEKLKQHYQSKEPVVDEQDPFEENPKIYNAPRDIKNIETKYSDLL